VFDALIDRRIPSGLDSPYTISTFREQVAGELATIIVALPIFAWVSRTISSGISRRPEMVDSGVRKWLTYIALVIAALCLVGDGIWFLTAFLTGDLSLRFVFKTGVLVVLAGAAFTYSLSTVRGDPVAPRRDRAYAGFALAIALDDRRVESLVVLSAKIHDDRQEKHRKAAPKNLSRFVLQAYELVDPETKIPYEYHPLAGTSFELCAVFAQNSEPSTNSQFKHGRGRTCFKRDAADSPY